MITIYAEKPDVGTKIAAALDAVTLDSGKRVSFEELGKYEKQIKALRARQGYLQIRYLNQDAFVTWGYGHMCRLKQAYEYNEAYKNWRNLPLPYIPDSYELTIMGGAGKQYQVVKNCFQRSDLIVCATDNDREGDLIFDYIYRYMGCKVPFKRAIFNKQAKEEYQKAFSSNQLIDSTDRLPIIESGRARSAGDFVAGAGPTVAMSLKNPGRGVLSVGRVQTATLNIVVTRELEIQNFKAKDYYVVKGLFQSRDGEEYIGTHEIKRFDKKEDAVNLLNKLLSTDKIGVVSQYKTKQYKKSRPYLCNLDSLQMDANRAYGFSLDKTLKLAQSLYEGEYITYPRGDSVHLPEDMAREMTGVIEGLFEHPRYAHFATPKAPDKSDKHYFDNSKVESHYAIVPTTKPAVGLKDDEQKIYDMIAMMTICMVYPDATLSRTEVITDVHGEKFCTNGTSIVDAGFYRVLGMPKEKILPSLKEGDSVCSKFAIDEKKTEPPKRYTAATLLNAMLNCGRTIEDEELKKLMANGPGGKPRGLGRPSSRASIVSTLENRNYIETKGKTIVPTEKGMSMIDSFPVEDLKSATMTAQWEKRLDDIEKGKDSYDSFMNDLEDSVRKWTREILESEQVVKQEEDLLCPMCGRPLRETSWGLGCTGYGDEGCKFSIGKVANKKLTRNQIKSLLEGKRVHAKGLVSKKGNRFEADLLLCMKGENKGKVFFDFSQDSITRQNSGQN